MPGYWNAHSDRDWEDHGNEPDPADPLEIAEEEARILREQVDDLKATIARLSEDINAATKWAAAYERQHGPFDLYMMPPDFMIPFCWRS